MTAQDLVDLLNSKGCSLTRVAESLNVTPQRVAQLLKEKGVTVNKVAALKSEAQPVQRNHEQG